MNPSRVITQCGNRPSVFRVSQMSIAPDNQGTLETLRIMARLAKEAIEYRDFCVFVQNVVMREVYSMANVPDDIDRYLRSIYRYSAEEIETLYSPAYNVFYFKNHGYLTGDCDDIAMLYAAVFNAFGYRSKFVAMRTRINDPLFYHVVVEVLKDNRQWKRYDATVPLGTVHVHYGTMEVEV